MLGKLFDNSFQLCKYLSGDSIRIPSLRDLQDIYGDNSYLYIDYLYNISLSKDTLIDHFINTSYNKINKYKFKFLNKEIKNLFKVSKK